MEVRGKRKEIDYDLTRLLSNSRMSIMVIPFLIGLLPSAGALFLAAPVFENISKDYLIKEEKAFVTSYYRHISESFLPTYSYIILAVNLAGVSMGMFQAAMLPSMFLLFLLGYVFYVRKIPNVSMGEQKKLGTRMKQLGEQY